MAQAAAFPFNRAGAALLLAFLGVNLLVYANRLPVYHEEPRRLIIAQEMLLSGDFVAPTVLQQPYFKKPPLHNWIIAGVSALLGGVSAFSGRLVSVLALLILGVTVYRLIEPEDEVVAWVAMLVTTTNYLLFAGYGNKAEPDLTITLFTFLSYAVYIRHPTRLGSVVLSGLFMGCGILAKGVAPIYFYPAMALHTSLQGDRRTRGVYLALHFTIALLPPLAWLGAYAVHGDLGAMLGTLFAQASARTGGGLGEFLGHLVRFPVEIFGVLLPWSLLLLLALRPARQDSEVYRSSRMIFIVSLILFLFISHSKPRYFMPAVPFFCVAAAYRFDSIRPIAAGLAQVAALGAAGVSAALAVYLAATGHWAQVGVFALLFLASLTVRGRHLNTLQLAGGLALFLIAVHIHGVYFLRSVNAYDHPGAARQIAQVLTEDLPVVIHDHEVPIQTAFYLEALLERPLHLSRDPDLPAFYLLSAPRDAPARGEELLRIPYPKSQLPELVVQRVGVPGGNRPSFSKDSPE